MRHSTRIFLAGALGSLALLALWFRPDPPTPAWAQGVGIFSRASCTQINAPVASESICWDQTAGTWRVYNGAAWSSVTATNVGAFGAVGDGTTTDTTAIQNALNSGAGAVVLPAGQNYKVGALTIPSTVRWIGGGATLTQANQDSNIFTATDARDLTIADLNFQMVAADRFASGNNAVQINGSTSTIGDARNVTLRNLHILNAQHRGILVRYTRGLAVMNTVCDGCSAGPAFESVEDARISGNLVNAPQYTGQANGLSLNTETNTPSSAQHNRRVALTGNIVTGQTNGQAYLVHDCQDCVLTGNVSINNAQGLALQPVGGGTQNVTRVSVAGYVHDGATSGNAAGSSGYGISISGDGAANLASAISVNGAVITRSNAVVQAGNIGAIMLNGDTRSVSITGSTFSNVYGIGIRVAGAANQYFVIAGNTIDPVLAATDTTSVGVFLVSGGHAGAISGNVFNTVRSAIRSDGSNASVTAVNNTMQAVTNTVDASVVGTLIGPYSFASVTSTALVASASDHNFIGGGLRIGTPTGGNQGSGTVTVASAVYTNGGASLVASGSRANLTNVRGLSASSSLSNNLAGSCTFAGATCQVAFANNEPDANYFVVVGGVVDVSNKTRAGFTLTATGTRANAVDWLLVR